MPAAPVQTASWAQRFPALFVDWFVCSLVALIFVPDLFNSDGDPAKGLVVHALFLVQSVLLMSTMGGSFGQLLFGIRVTRMDGTNRPPDLLRSTLRQVLVLLVIPPLVFRPDGRGLHDMAANTSTNTLESLRS